MHYFLYFFLGFSMVFVTHTDAKHHKGQPPVFTKYKQEYKRAIARIQPTKGNQVQGTFTFLQGPDGVDVSVELSGLTPNAKHGVHIHQYGDISSEDGKSAGGHYNPEKNPHGLAASPKRHAGSFGNIQANANGEASINFTDHTFTIAGHKNPVIGRAVVVHANEDTGEQPAGNAGPRIGLGVIGVAAP